jgi:hypothetical protein
MKVPNFVIAGAPKTGTTALTEYLRLHPDVFMSRPKELHYFAEDLPSYRAVATPEEYRNLFAAAVGKYSAIGEGSVFYLYSDIALQRLREFNPDIRLIVMFRDVVSFLESMHSQLLFSREETEESFEKAWHLSVDRKRGRHIPKTCREVKLLYYDEVGKFGSQYQKLLSLFPASQVLAIFFDDFSSDTPAVYRQVLEFLGVRDYVPGGFKKINERKMHKSTLVANLVLRPRPVLQGIAIGVKKLLGGRRLGVMDALSRFNIEKRPKPVISELLRRNILREYEQDMALLEQLTGRNLSAWRQ